MNIEVFITENEINQKIQKLAEYINNDYKNSKKLIVVGLLKGSIMFMSDLIKQLKIPVYIDFMTVSSYGNETVSSREVKIIKDMDENIMGEDVLIVEDIIDTGLTLNKIMEILKSREPKSIKICTFLSKSARREVKLDINYIGYEIPDEFVIGYGLDYAGRYRNLPYVGIMKGEK